MDRSRVDPYVVTLALDEASQARFDAERREWFPAGRTQVGAHVTLFHAVPGELDVDPALLAATDRPGFEATVSEVYPLGRGVAYRLESDDLARMHGVLREAWEEHLTRQDAQPFRPHVTVQNKVDPQAAKETLARLAASFVPTTVEVLGLDLWAYRNGPWEHLRRYALR